VCRQIRNFPFFGEPMMASAKGAAPADLVVPTDKSGAGHAASLAPFHASFIIITKLTLGSSRLAAKLLA